MKEQSKLIAEFMGYKTYELNGYDMVEYSECNVRTLQDIHYHTSWDWLMPVLKNINLKLHPDTYGFWRMINRPTEYHIEQVYTQAVEFIKNYNDGRQ
tara:strand:- start:12309 stop:12599 length:291 start_codon:yes stop_codon:yes gene_type:complete